MTTPTELPACKLCGHAAPSYKTPTSRLSCENKDCGLWYAQIKLGEWIKLMGAPAPAEVDQSQWHPVSENPPREDIYLAMYYHGPVVSRWTMATGWMCDSKDDEVPVTHWTDLPAAPGPEHPQDKAVDRGCDKSCAHQKTRGWFKGTPCSYCSRIHATNDNHQSKEAT